MKRDHYENRRTFYFGAEMLAEMRAEAKRLDRPLSWVIQQAWAIAKDRFTKVPSINIQLSDARHAVNGKSETLLG